MFFITISLTLASTYTSSLTQDPHGLPSYTSLSPLFHQAPPHTLTQYHSISLNLYSSNSNLPQFSSSRDVPLVSLRRTTSNTTPGIGGGPRSLLYNSYNKTENNVLVTSDAEVRNKSSYNSLFVLSGACISLSIILLKEE